MNYENMHRVSRGGSWRYDAEHSHGARRSHWHPCLYGGTIGYRLVSKT